MLIAVHEWGLRAYLLPLAMLVLSSESRRRVAPGEGFPRLASLGPPRRRTAPHKVPVQYTLYLPGRAEREL